MTWETCTIEKMTENALHTTFGEARGDEIFTSYKQARNGVLINILPDINRKLPHHTDHGPEHVKNVLDNVVLLLGEDCIGHDRRVSLSPVEAYCLLEFILYHDVGNIYGREGHQNHVGEAYDYVHSKEDYDPQEKMLVMRAAAAHCGEASDGSTDTQKYLAERDYFLNHEVRLRDLTAILRLADELAEGPQRTSTFMMKQGYPKGSSIYHKYAEASHIFIDRLQGRIAITYHIDVEISEGSLSDTARQELEEFLSFIDQRVTKLYEEMLYTTHYSHFLEPFKAVSIKEFFWIDGSYTDLGLERVILEPYAVPGSLEKLLSASDSTYEPVSVIKKVQDEVRSIHGSVL